MGQVTVRSRSKALNALLHPVTLFILLLLVAVRAFAGSATLAWDPVTSSALAGYMVYYGPTAGNYTSKLDVGNTTTYTVPNLTDGATYHFAVTAYDASRTESGFSNDASTTVAAGAPVANFAASTTSGVAPLALNFTSTSTGSITTYAWTFGDGTSSSAQSPSHVYSAAGTYTVSLTVTGSGGSNTKTMANYIKVTAPVTTDTTAPSAPSSLAATASGSTAVNLTWQASTDNVGVTGYRVERCQGAGCTTFTQIATPTGTSFTDSALSAGTSYSYRVRAADAAGNLSGYSNTATATTASGTTAGSLTGTSAPVTATVDLTSSGTTDWVQLPGYVRKATGGGQIGDPVPLGGATGKTYSDDGRMLKWSDGSPTTTGTSTGGISVSGTGTGLQITAPADTTTRTLTVYVGAQNATGTFMAHLSDGSAADYVQTLSAQKMRQDGTYTLTYRAASAGQTLTVSWTMSRGPKARGGSGNVSLQGATLR